jgi:formylglycine-generating enzyme required for sulfatase activity
MKWQALILVLLSGFLCGSMLAANTNISRMASPAASSNIQSNKVVTNSLGMRFVEIPEGRVWFCIWETRVKDYQLFCEATGRDFNAPGFRQTAEHPVVNVNWDDAQAFCRWLTGKERNEGKLDAKQKYRLPTDLEWSATAGLGIEQGQSPEQRMKSLLVWPWGYYWPPLPGDGNYGPELQMDNFPNTAPVGNFKPNRLGVYDLGGNVWEWCEDWYNEAQVTKVLRGGSFNDSMPAYLLVGYRFSGTMNLSNEDIGFRVVREEGREK